MDATKYRTVEETFPYFDVTFPSEETGCLNCLEIAGFGRNRDGGTKVYLTGNNVPINIKDDVKDFETRLFACLAVDTLGDVDEPPMTSDAAVNRDIQPLTRETIPAKTEQKKK